MTALLEVTGLSLSGHGGVALVQGLDLTLEAGRSLALVGESGSGKSLTCRAVCGLLPSGVARVSGSIRFHGEELTAMTPREMTRLRGASIGMVLQDPMSSLNPVLRVGAQIAEVFRWHGGPARRRERWRRAVDVMRQVRIPAAEARAGAWPHQFSGGMRQRIAIGAAIAAGPALLIADEPTTALDVTIRQQILALLGRIQREQGTALLLVTHDLATVGRHCDEVAVMYAGHVVERGPVERVFASPAHPYTAGLLAAVPRITPEPEPLLAIPGQPPQTGEIVTGCAFAPRCARAEPRCRTEQPPLRAEGNHAVACWAPRAALRQAA